MKMILFILVLGALVGCQKATKSITTTTTNPSTNPTPNYCTSNPMGHGCPQYCAANPNVCTADSGTTNGSTTSGSIIGGNSQYRIIPPSDNNWTELYPSGVPTENCPAPTGTGFDLRRGTVTLAGHQGYSPDIAWSSMGNSQYTTTKYTHNNSSFLVNVPEAKAFLDTDSKLKIRIKARPQPKPPRVTTASNGTRTYYTWCFGRQTGLSADTFGYGTLSFSVSLRGVNADGSLMPGLIATRYVSAHVNGCSPTMDFSGVNQSYPHGLVIVINDVSSNQGCWYQSGCTSMTTVAAKSCWSMDIEVAVDGTKDI
jgi:hypothetical protein